MSFDSKRLYELLPAMYRIRDTELGLQALSPEQRTAIERTGDYGQVYGPLRSMLSIIADQVAVLEENLDQLYDDQFIETCAEWVISYIGQMVGNRDLIPIPGSRFSRRAEVANTIKYRRRKGTAAVVEQLAKDVTGWDANVVEYFQRLATMQYMNHLRPGNIAMADVRGRPLQPYLGTPFDATPHTIDVRRIESRRGRYNIANMGVFLWRLKNYASTAFPAHRIDDRRYTFDPLGINRPLFSLLIPEEEITHLAEPENVPMPISRRMLAQELERLYGAGKSIHIQVDGLPVPPGQLEIAYLRDGAETDGMVEWENMPEDKVVLDPVRGRIAFPPGSDDKPLPQQVVVSYQYGFSMDTGGGEYEREGSFSAEPDLIVEIEPGAVMQDALDELYRKLLEDENAQIGVAELSANDYYRETPIIKVPPGKTIEIRAKNGKRPVWILDGPLRIEAGERSALIFNGLWINGGRIFAPDLRFNKLRLLRIAHCTIFGSAVAAPAIELRSLNTRLEMDKCIAGPLRIIDGGVADIRNSILDAGAEDVLVYAGAGIPSPVAASGDESTEEEDAGGTLDDVWKGTTKKIIIAKKINKKGKVSKLIITKQYVDCDPEDSEGPAEEEELPIEEEEIDNTLTELPGAPLTIINSTLIGSVHAAKMVLASNCIFMAAKPSALPWPEPVRIQQIQEGCVRFSYCPPGSRLPRTYRCQPAAPEMNAAVRPIFTSRQYGHPAYCQLHGRCPAAISGGADDEAEMGAFHDLYQPQRVANLRTRLDEYLRFGMEAGIFFAS